MPGQKVSRAIMFSRAFTGGERDRDATEKIARLLPSIDALDFEFDGRYVGKEEDGRWLCLWVVRRKPPVRLTLAWLTDRDLPQTEHKGEVGDLELRDGYHLRHPAHMVLFEEGILGFEYWKPAPRAWALAEYLNQRGYAPTRSDPKLSFDLLYRKESIAELLEGKPMRSLQVRVPVAKSVAVERANASLSASLRELQRISDEVVANLELGPPLRSRGRLDSLRDLARRLFAIRKEAEIDKLIAKYYTEENETATIDLLEPKLMQTRDFMLLRTSGRAVDPDSAFDLIEKVYRDQRTAILDAAGSDPE